MTFWKWAGASLRALQSGHVPGGSWGLWRAQGPAHSTRAEPGLCLASVTGAWKYTSRKTNHRLGDN